MESSIIASQSSLHDFVHAWLWPSGTSSWNWTLLGSESGERTRDIAFSSWLFENIFFLSLMILQCALLHPKFQHSSFARLTRLALGPLLISWWLSYPFRLPIEPIEQRSVFSGAVAVIMVLKSIEWTFASGPYHIRELKTIKGVPVWKNDSIDKDSSQQSGLGDFILWIASMFISQRGMRCSWGPTGKGNQQSFTESAIELIRLQLVTLPCLAFVLYSQDESRYGFDPTKAVISLGVPPFLGLSLVANCLHSACTMFLLSCTIETTSAILVLLTYLLYPMAQKLGCSTSFSKLLNPENYPPQFGPMFELSSVAHFWGKTWHQKFRRAFVFCGGKPAIFLARVLGAPENVQKIFGVMAVFALSGAIHEFMLYAFQQATYPYPRELFKTFPASFLFFFVQSFGVILEPFIIPHIPKRLGGAKLWTASFLFLTAPLFTRDVGGSKNFFNRYRPLHEWSWLELVIPVPLGTNLVRKK